MHRQIVAIVIGVASLLLGAARCWAWNSTGHETVALIAWDNLSPDARAKLTAVLNNHPRVDADLLADASPDAPRDVAVFIRAATWPDIIRAPMHPLHRTEHHGPWHYVDYPFELEGVKGPAVVETWDGKSDPVNILQAYAKCLAGLKDPATPKDRKAIDLCWVEHLVGDVHQPLHAASLYSNQYPQGDQGGNAQFIHDPKSNFPNENLHAYWDDVEGMSLNYDDIRKAADRIEKEHPSDSLKDQIADSQMVDWAKESYALAKEKVYLNGTLPHATRDQIQANPNGPAPALTDQYTTDALATADVRMALAGYRLAAVLEDAAKSLDMPPSTDPAK